MTNNFIAQQIADDLKTNGNYTISSDPPLGPIIFYEKNHPEWRQYLSKFGASDPKRLVRSISRMPGGANSIREDECHERLHAGKIRGYIIIADSIRNGYDLDICFEINVAGRQAFFSEQINVPNNPIKKGSEKWGFYSHVCDSEDCSQEFLGIFKELTTTLSDFFKKSFANPETDLDKYLIMAIRSLDTPPSESVFGFVGDTYYCRYLFEGCTYWVRMGYRSSAPYDQPPQVHWYDAATTKLINEICQEKIEYEIVQSNMKSLRVFL